MRKTIMFLSIIIGLVCSISLLFPASSLQIVGVDEPIAWIGFSIAALGILFAWDWLQQLNLRVVFHMAALVLMALTVLAIASPTYGGLLGNYVHFADNVITFEGAIVLWLLGSEQRKEHLPILLYCGFCIEYFFRSLSRHTSFTLPLHNSSHPHA